MAGESVKGETTTTEPSRVQEQLARRIAESRATIPDVTATVVADVQDAVGRPEGLAVLAARAAALALREHPKVNGAYRDARFDAHGRVNVGVGIATAAGLVVPVLADADRKDAAALTAELDALAAAAHDGSLTSPSLRGATFTVVHEPGLRRFTAVVTPGQAAVLAVGGAEAQPVVRHDGTVVVRHVAELTLAVDHRVLSAADAAAFLGAVAARLAAPEAL